MRRVHRKNIPRERKLSTSEIDDTKGKATTYVIVILVIYYILHRFFARPDYDTTPDVTDMETKLVEDILSRSMEVNQFGQRSGGKQKKLITSFEVEEKSMGTDLVNSRRTEYYPYSCYEMITNGKWVNFRFYSEEAYFGDFVPVANCKVHPYSEAEIKQCFDLPTVHKHTEEMHGKNVVIVGDSRSRQIYRVLVEMYKGNEQVTDTKPPSGEPLTDGPFTFYWSQNWSGEAANPNRPAKSYFSKLESVMKDAQLVILGEQAIHPITDAVMNVECRDMKYLKQFFMRQFEYLTTEILPMLEKFTEENGLGILYSISLEFFKLETHYEYDNRTNEIVCEFKKVYSAMDKL